MTYSGSLSHPWYWEPGHYAYGTHTGLNVATYGYAVGFYIGVEIQRDVDREIEIDQPTGATSDASQR